MTTRTALKALAVVVLAFAVMAIAVRAWISARIDAAAVETTICLRPDERAKLESEATPLAQRDLIVVKAAQFAASANTGSHVGWSLKGLAIDIGFRTLWTAKQRVAIFRKILPRIRSCGRRLVV